MNKILKQVVKLTLAFSPLLFQMSCQQYNENYYSDLTKNRFSIAQSAISKLNEHYQNNEIIIKPMGEYADIDVAKSNEAADILLLETPSSQDKKREVAKKVEENLGDYNPIAILGLANYYLDEGSIEKFSLYSRFALFRAIVDVKLANDNSLDDVVPTLRAKFADLANQKYLSKGGNIDDLKRALAEATEQIIKMDKEIARNYDLRWPSLHSAGAFVNAPLTKLNKAEKDAIIEQERQNFIEAARNDGIIIQD